jgi:hypothetical protein
MEKEKEITETESGSSEIQDLIPQMNVSVPIEQNQQMCLISDDHLMGMYDEIQKNFRKDRKEVTHVLREVTDMVINGGDSSSSSKELLSNLWKIKTDINDNMTKIAELATRIKLKSPDTYKPYLTAKQENKTTINITGRRQLLKKIEQSVKDEEQE